MRFIYCSMTVRIIDFDGLVIQVGLGAGVEGAGLVNITAFSIGRSCVRRDCGSIVRRPFNVLHHDGTPTHVCGLLRCSLINKRVSATVAHTRHSELNDL